MNNYLDIVNSVPFYVVVAAVLAFVVAMCVVFLVKSYNGFDPDVSSEGKNSTLRRIDLGAYPKARTVKFAVQIKY